MQLDIDKLYPSHEQSGAVVTVQRRQDVIGERRGCGGKETGQFKASHCRIKADPDPLQDLAQILPHTFESELKVTWDCGANKNRCICEPPLSVTSVAGG